MKWTKYVNRFARRFVKPQSCAICYSLAGGEPRFLLVSRTKEKTLLTLPKGSVELGEKIEIAAQREAFEEAGVTGTITKFRIGVFHYRKSQLFPIYKVHVFGINVDTIHDIYPEAQTRMRFWMDIDQASANLSPKMRIIIRKFNDYLSETDISSSNI